MSVEGPEFTSGLLLCAQSYARLQISVVMNSKSGAPADIDCGGARNAILFFGTGIAAFRPRREFGAKIVAAVPKLDT